MKSSVGFHFSPNNGVSKVKVGPGEIQFLGASIANKEVKKKK